MLPWAHARGVFGLYGLARPYSVAVPAATALRAVHVPHLDLLGTLESVRLDGLQFHMPRLREIARLLSEGRPPETSSPSERALEQWRREGDSSPGAPDLHYAGDRSDRRADVGVRAASGCAEAPFSDSIADSIASRIWDGMSADISEDAEREKAKRLMRSQVRSSCMVLERAGFSSSRLRFFALSLPVEALLDPARLWRVFTFISQTLPWRSEDELRHSLYRQPRLLAEPLHVLVARVDFLAVQLGFRGEDLAQLCGERPDLLVAETSHLKGVVAYLSAIMGMTRPHIRSALFSSKSISSQSVSDLAARWRFWGAHIGGTSADLALTPSFFDRDLFSTIGPRCAAAGRAASPLLRVLPSQASASFAAANCMPQPASVTQLPPPRPAWKSVRKAVVRDRSILLEDMLRIDTRSFLLLCGRDSDTQQAWQRCLEDWKQVERTWRSSPYNPFADTAHAAPRPNAPAAKHSLPGPEGECDDDAEVDGDEPVFAEGVDDDSPPACMNG